MLEREQIEVPCPDGGRPIKTTYGEIARKSSLRSSKGHEYKFKYSDQSKMKRAMDQIARLQKDMERSQKEFFEAYQNLLANADILLKR
tara:strand:+ start:603 stop:866 length:264 start_codon:yes stop_codon:yes gene_type:complete